SVYHVGDTITYTIGGGGPVDHIVWGEVLLSPDIKHITWEDYGWDDLVTCSVSGNTVTCNEVGGPGWGFGGYPGLKISGTIAGGTKLVSSCTFAGYDEDGNPMDPASASNTAKVIGMPIPEFPSAIFPVVLVIGFLGAVLFIRRTREN
ncbi:MAG: hypothetical protein WCE65_05525, partial [Methanoregula sp.]